VELRDLSVDLVDEPSYDVREYIIQEELEELTESIKAVGVLKPIRVFKVGDRYEIEDGHRRYLAAKAAGLQTIPALVVDSEEELREVKKLHANIFSKDLTPIELSRTLNYLRHKFNYSVDDLARLMGKSQGRISQLLALANYPSDLVELMEDGKLSEYQARYLNQIKDDKKRKYYAKYAVDRGATLETLRAWVQRERAEEELPPPQEDTYYPEPPSEPAYVPMARCSCCHNDFRQDTLLTMKFCGECYTDLTNLMPSIYAALRAERRSQDEESHESSETE